MSPTIIKFAKASKDANIPVFAHNGDSGFDLYVNETVMLLPNDRKKIKTGLVCDLPHNYEIQIRPRSGVSTNTKIEIIFATIDSCYRGEIHIIAHNTDSDPIVIEKGSSIAQGVINRLPTIIIEEIDFKEISSTSRGTDGFGSTTKQGISQGRAGETPVLIHNRF